MAEEEDKATAGSDSQPTPVVEPEPAASALTEAEEIAAKVAGARPKKKSDVEAKGHATPKQKAPTTKEKKKRTTPVQFVRESIEELRKVIWPTLSQLQQYFIVVLVFVLAMIAFVSALDLLFGWGLLQLFGQSA